MMTSEASAVRNFPLLLPIDNENNFLSFTFLLQYDYPSFPAVNGIIDVDKAATITVSSRTSDRSCAY
jgi:hypothetical protein